MSIQKNNTIELFKLFASYMVIFIHVPFYGIIGDSFNAIARFAVPLFFLISGFFSYQITTEKIKKRTIKTLSLLIFAVVCYTIFNNFESLLKCNIDGIVAYFKQYIDLRTLVKFIIFNLPVSAEHLWYLYAMVYVYVLFYFVTMFGVRDNVIFIISLLLLFLHILLGEFLSVFGIVLPALFVRNFALMGIPFFTLGIFVKKYENKMLTIPNHVIIASFVIGVFESVASRYLYGRNELFIGSLFILFAIVCVFIKYSQAQYSSFFTVLEGCSTYIYIFHIVIARLIKKIYVVFHIDFNSNIILKNMHPILVCIVSTILAYFIIWIVKKNSKTNYDTRSIVKKVM